MKKHCSNLVKVIRSNVLIFSLFVLVIGVAIVYSTFSRAQDATLAIPLAPTNLSLGGTTTTTIYLQWVDNATNEDKFNVERKLATASDWTGSWSTQITSVDVTSYVDTAVIAGVVYDYRVQACLSGTGCSDYTYLSGVSITTTSSGGAGSGNGGGITSQIPAAPTGLMLNGTATATTVSLKWNDNSTNEDHFKIERKFTNSTGYNYTQFSVPANTTTWTDTGITAGGTYDYRIQACLTATVCSDYANLFGIIVPVSGGGNGAGNTTAAPAPVAGFSATSGVCGINSITLSWQESSLASGYKIYRAGNLIYTTTNLGYVDTGLTFSTSYSYTIYAYNSIGASSGVSVTGMTSPICTSSAPVKPTNLSAVVNGKNVVLTWVDNSSNEAGFKIYRGPNWTDIGNVGANVTTFTDSNRPAGTYTYRLNAFNSSNVYSGITNDVTVVVGSDGGSGSATGNVGNGNSGSPGSGSNNTGTGSSNAGSSSTSVPTAPLAPTTLLAKVVDNNVILTWTDNSSNEAGFKIYRGPNWTDIGNVGANVTTFTDSNRPAGTYTYRLNAFNSSNVYSGITNDVTVVVGNNTTANTPNTSTNPPVVPTVPPPTTNTPPATSNTVITNPLSVTAPVLNNIVSTLFPTTNITDQSSTQNSTTVTAAKIPITEPTNAIILNQPITEITNKPNQNISNTTNVPNEVVPQLQGLGNIIGSINSEVEDARKDLIKIVDRSIDEMLKNIDSSDKSIDLVSLYDYRDSLVGKINSKLNGSITLSKEDLKNVEAEVTSGLNEMRKLLPSKTSSELNKTKTSEAKETLDTLNKFIQEKSESFKDQGGDLLYKDSNKDGISDYDSIYVYNLDPVKQSVVTTYKGSIINAAEKIMLGFDPSKTNLTTVEKEQPTESTAPVMPIYKVENVKLTEKKGITFKGKALPNSFVTLYLYSTPIIVTVKTDSDGVWQYTLDKELEDGNHTIYTATVNNTGKILAKSAGSAFFKTAEAVTLDSLPLTGGSVNADKPGMLKGNDNYLLIAFILVVFLISIILTGFITKKMTSEEK